MKLDKTNRRGVFVGGYLKDELRDKLIEVQEYLAQREQYREPTITDALNFVISEFDIKSLNKRQISVN